MFDFRESKEISLSECNALTEDSNAYLYIDPVSGKKYVVKYYTSTDPIDEMLLINEFKKMALLSAEPEIGNVYGLVTVSDGYKYFTGYLMDFIEGKSLQDYLATNITYDIYINILKQMSIALEKCHHYDVQHNDLNFDNLMIDFFGNVKLIDFFYDIAQQKPEDVAKIDIDYFKKVERALFDKLSPKDNVRAAIISKYCKSINVFTGLSKTISLLDEISFDFGLLEQQLLPFLSRLTLEIHDGFTMSYYVPIEELDVPKLFIPDLTEKEVSRAEKNSVNIMSGKGPLFPDTRRRAIREHVESYLETIFYPLRALNLADFKLSLMSESQFYGPFTINLNVTVLPKLIKWKNVNERVKILPGVEEVDWKEILFSADLMNSKDEEPA